MPAADHHDDGRRPREEGGRRRGPAGGDGPKSTSTAERPGEADLSAGAAAEPGSDAPATVGGLGEDGLLRVIGRELSVLDASRPWPAGSLGIGDDAALLPSAPGGTLVSTDAMAEGHDWLPVWPAGVRTRGYDVGWKAAAQNLSDVNAMGGIATGLVTALSIPPTTRVDWVAGVARGMASAVRRLGAEECRAAGGDLGRADRAGLAVTVLGRPGPQGAVRRTMDARDLEALCAEGGELLHAGTSPGWAAAGLALLFTDRTELRDRWAALAEQDRPGPRELARAVRAQLRPRPPLDAGPAAAAALACAMDVSDGLLRDAGRLATANGMQAHVDPGWLAEASAPLRRLGLLLDVAPQDWVLHGGEDYGLVGVLRPGVRRPEGFRTIGQVVPGGVVAPAQDAPDATSTERGWDHFA